MEPAKCFNCGEHGHFASSCPARLGADFPDQPRRAVIMCWQCARPKKDHDRSEAIECAWRGHTCLNCNSPPHPDNWPGRCERYAHPSDTPGRRRLRDSQLCAYFS